MGSISEIKSHMDQAYDIPIRDPLWKHIYLSKAHMNIVATKEFQQLSRIKQLGPSFLVYPGATHTRLNHSLGVFLIAQKMIRAIISSPRCPSLSLEAVKAFLSAALLHDLGHFPYTHSLKELALKEHEELTAEIILTSPIKKYLENDLGTSAQLVAEIVDNTRKASSSEVEFFRNILSGALDPDKLDYLNRDAYFCGVPYGLQDVDYILSIIEPIKDRGLAIQGEGISAIENLLFSKYLMYRAVYWHRTVRIATGMIKQALYLGLEEGIIKDKELYGLDDESFVHELANKPAPYFQLIKNVSERKIYKTIIEVPFLQEIHGKMELNNLNNRHQLESKFIEAIQSEVGQKLQSYDLIIDVPESISFEADIPVIYKNDVKSYLESNTVFTPGVVKDFTSTLRLIRVACNRTIAAKLNPAFIDSLRLFLE